MEKIYTHQKKKSLSEMKDFEFPILKQKQREIRILLI